MIEPTSIPTPMRRAMHRPNALIQPCGACPACKSGKPRQCVRFGPEVAPLFPKEMDYPPKSLFKDSPHADSCAQEPDTSPVQVDVPVKTKDQRRLKCRTHGFKTWRCNPICNGPHSLEVPPNAISRDLQPVVATLTPESVNDATSAGQGQESPRAAIDVFLPCIPPTTTAQQKGVRVANGKPIFFTKGKVKKAEAQIRQLLAPIVPKEPMTGPLKLEIEFVFPYRSTESKATKAQFHMPKDTKPDCSNSVKVVEDQMTGLGFFGDDGQIAQLVVKKWWGIQAGIGIKLTAL